MRLIYEYPSISQAGIIDIDYCRKFPDVFNFDAEISVK